MSYWVPVLIFFSLGLLIVSVFRSNIFIYLAAIAVNLGLTRIIGAPLAVIWAGYLLAGAETLALAACLVWGTGKKGRDMRKRRFMG